MNNNNDYILPENEATTHNGIGYLIVKASTASESIPIAGARVTIYDNENDNAILYSLITDSSGLSERVSIPTASSTESQAPGNSKPFSTVNIEVIFSGYSPVRFLNVPIFDGILSVQRTNMVPLSENGENFIFDFNEWSNYPVAPNNL